MNCWQKLLSGVWEISGPKMIIRHYLPGDCRELADLFYNTVHTINAKDYTREQLDAWASGQVDLSEWNQTFWSITHWLPLKMV